MSMCNMEHATKTSPEVEIWRPVRGFEGIYEVSDLGRVRSLDRQYINKAGYVKHENGRIMSIQKDIYGYNYVKLRKPGYRKMVFVHRIVAEAFVPNPNNLPQINHKDECKTNNVPSNLEWCDVAYNVNYGTGKFRKTLSWVKRIEQLTIDGKHVAYYQSAADAERQSNGRYSSDNIGMAARGTNKTAYGYVWKYI